MAKKLLNIATFGVAGALFGKSGKKKAAEPVKDGPIVMPLADDDAIKRARRRSITEQMGRGGRSSTILSGDSDSLGG